MFLVELIASSFFYLISKQARRECRCKRILVLFIVQFLYSFFLEVLFGGALDHLNCQTTGEFDQNFSKKSKRGGIHHLHISHNMPCLPPKILHKHCLLFQFSWHNCNTQRQNKGYAKIWGANKVYYGRCSNSEWAVLELTGS